MNMLLSGRVAERVAPGLPVVTLATRRAACERQRGSLAKLRSDYIVPAKLQERYMHEGVRKTNADISFAEHGARLIFCLEVFM